MVRCLQYLYFLKFVVSTKVLVPRDTVNCNCKVAITFEKETKLAYVISDFPYSTVLIIISYINFIYFLFFSLFDALQTIVYNQSHKILKMHLNHTSHAPFILKLSVSRVADEVFTLPQHPVPPPLWKFNLI